MSYKVNMIYSDGEESMQDAIFDTEDEAEEYGIYLCQCFKEGGDILEAMGEDYDDSEPGFQIIEC